MEESEGLRDVCVSFAFGDDFSLKGMKFSWAEFLSSWFLKQSADRTGAVRYQKGG